MNVKYKLESIAETEFKMNYEFDYSKFIPDKLHIQLSHSIKPVMDSDRIVINVKASLLYEDGEILLAENGIIMVFGLSPIKDVIVMKADGTFTSQNAPVIDTFLVAAVGALRGALMKNLKGTPLEKCFIPLIPLDKFRPKEN